MRLRNGAAAVAVTCGLAVTGIAGAGAAQAVTPTTAAVKSAPHKSVQQMSLQQMLDVVRHQVQSSYPAATLMVAAGDSPSGKTKDMSKVTDWQLVYNTNDSSSEIQSVEVHATLQGDIGKQIPHTQPWGGVMAVRDEIGMTPEKAYSILQSAGYHDAYQYVSVVKPLVADARLQYHFSNTPGGCDGYAVNVDNRAVNPICA